MKTSDEQCRLMLMIMQRWGKAGGAVIKREKTTGFLKLIARWRVRPMKKRCPKVNGLPLSPEKRIVFFFDFLLDSLLVEGANGRPAKYALLHIGGHARKLHTISPMGILWECRINWWNPCCA